MAVTIERENTIQISGRQCLVPAVPGLDTYRVQTGIGRVFHSLCAYWGNRVQPIRASFSAFDVPVLRNRPLGVQAPSHADLVLLPKLTGAEALRRTGGLPSVVIVHDIGIIDFPGDRQGID